MIGGEPIAAEAFEDALEQAEQAAQAADRAAGEEGPVTQFELLTAAAFVALAAAKVKVGVIEAGLGGRLDATNVIPSLATVLTSVGLDHTEYLGDTLEEIAGEKLAVLRDRSVLIHGAARPGGRGGRRARRGGALRADARRRRAARRRSARTCRPTSGGTSRWRSRRPSWSRASCGRRRRRRGPGVAARSPAGLR